MKKAFEKRYILGLVLLAIGSLLLLNYFEIIPLWPVNVFSWKGILVLLGVIFLITDKNKTTGFILLGIGSAFLLTDFLDKSIWEVAQFVIPIMLITAGAVILFRRPRISISEINKAGDADVMDVINENCVFSGSERKIESKNFKGGSISCVFGGSEIDFRLAELTPGINAIEIFCLFGGVSIKVPEDWEVKTDINAVFGGFSDERSFKTKATENKPEKVLYIKGFVMFGGGELK